MIPAKFKNDAEFARALGVQQAYVHRWRGGVKPQIPMLLKISKVTGTSVETLAEIVGYEGGAS
jgi:transcriptional regulator with XRE-family HTH domain